MVPTWSIAGPWVSASASLHHHCDCDVCARKVLAGTWSRDIGPHAFCGESAKSVAIHCFGFGGNSRVAVWIQLRLATIDN